MAINYRKWDSLMDSSDEEDDSRAKLVQTRMPSKRHGAPAAPSARGPALSAKPAEAPAASAAAILGLPTLLTPPVPPRLGRAAVCTTVRGVCGRIESWVRWHLWVGFERLYIFFDDPSEVQSVRLAKAAGGSAVVPLVRGSEVLRAAWARQPSWQGMGANVDRDVQVRQLLNAQLAVELARASSLVWLLHIDSDELFLARPPSEPVGGPGSASSSAEAGTAVMHFASLAAAGCECFVYHNYEAVPESAPLPTHLAPCAVPPAGGPPTDPFVNLTLFKRCEAHVPARTHSQAAAALDMWRRRSQAGKYFLYYDNGKCACRVDTDAAWIPMSVHCCMPRKPNGEWDQARLQANAWTNDPRQVGLRNTLEEASAVLHYPVRDMPAR